MTASKKKQSRTAAEKYFSDVLSGEIVACKKIQALARKMLHDIENPGMWHFDEKKAERAVAFIERFCCMPAGKAHTPFLLEPYEKAIVQTVFGFVNDMGLRRFQECLIIVGRKNGKTSLAAAIELYMLIADGEFSPHIYNIATKLEQAELAFNACRKMVIQSKDIQNKVRKRSNDLFNDANLGFIRPLGSNQNTLDGLDVQLGVLDEIHAMKDRDLYDLIRQGMASRSQPLLFQITTNGFVRNAVFDFQYEYACKWLDGTLDEPDERFVAFVYELDGREEWLNENSWIKANPGLGTVKDAEFLKRNVAKAINDPTFRPTVMTKDFNLPENTSMAWLTFEEAVCEDTYDLEEMGFRYGIVGFDAAETIDLTCAQVLMMRPGDMRIYEKTMYWLPEAVIEADSASGKRKERDEVPYQAWIARGLLRTVPGNKVDKHVLYDWLCELKEECDIYTYAIGYDPWHMDDSTLRELEMFAGKSRVIPVRQGVKTLSQPMKQLRADYAIGRICDNHNPINEWCRMNVSVQVDINGNIQPVKKGKNPKNRIDGFMAELDAYIVLCNLMDEYSQIC